MSQIIRFSHVSKKYKQQSAVQDLDFEMEKGTITALIGVNGAGKTTTMEILMGHLHKEGTVSLWGHDLNHIKSGILPGKIYYVPEHKIMPCDIVLKDLIQASCNYHSSGLSINKDHLDSLITKMGLDPYLDQKIANLSLGQKAALYILIGLASNAELLVLDEPLSGLDPYIRNLIIDELKSSSWEGRTVFYSSHILEEVERVADKVIILHRGQKLYEGSIDELKEKYLEVILENPQNIEEITQKSSVIHFKSNDNGIVNLFIDKEQYKDDIPGKKYLLNLKEIFLYLIDVENKRMEDNK